MSSPAIANSTRSAVLFIFDIDVKVLSIVVKSIHDTRDLQNIDTIY
jgi:hypothetical protein